MSDFECTCGPYMSVIPPEPCPVHDPERAYWRMKLLREFSTGSSTTTTTNKITMHNPVHWKLHREMTYSVCGVHAPIFSADKHLITCKSCNEFLEGYKNE